jgi:hypothetical protein
MAYFTAGLLLQKFWEAMNYKNQTQLPEHMVSIRDQTFLNTGKFNGTI